ncbi:MAG: hypothetical protein GXP19_01490 [Gammaproteobacteria bacterium]|nr:hypothetical protein [Gammaproteobacteria bacterium]
MAVRIKSKWHRSSRSERNIKGSNESKTLKDLSSVIAFNMWKLVQNVFKHMEGEGFRFAKDEQVIAVLTELLAYGVHSVDRLIYEKVDEKQRGPFVIALAKDLAKTMEGNQIDLLGEGDYVDNFINTLNQRFEAYSECSFENKQPGYEFNRYLARNISDIMSETDDKWVVEQVMDIEIPDLFPKLKRLVEDVLGAKD